MDVEDVDVFGLWVLSLKILQIFLGFMIPRKQSPTGWNQNDMLFVFLSVFKIIIISGKVSEAGLNKALSRKLACSFDPELLY